MNFRLVIVLSAATALAGCSLELQSRPKGSAGRASSPLACPPSPAPGVFQNALCLCGDFNGVTQSFTTTSDAGSASVGVNGMANIDGTASIGGSFTAFNGLEGTGSVSASQDVVSTGTVMGLGTLSVGHDLSVGGNLMDVGSLTVGGTLRVAGQTMLLGGGSYTSGPYTAPAAPPCACDPSSFFDVAKAVADARTNNDNATLADGGIDGLGQQDLTLPTGRYYAANVTSLGTRTTTIDGAVALYLDGMLQSVGTNTFKLTAGSTLDLYVSGGIANVGQLDLGPDARDGALRLFLGGTSPVMLSVGTQSFHGLVYAPTATVAFVGDTEVQGAVFANNLDGVGTLGIQYVAPASPGEGVCAGDGDAGTPDTGSDAGSTPPPSPDAGSSTTDAGWPSWDGGFAYDAGSGWPTFDGGSTVDGGACTGTTCT